MIEPKTRSQSLSFPQDHLDTDPPFGERPEPRGRIRVLCVDDCPDAVGLMARLIDAQPDMESVGVLPCADRVLDEIERCGPAVVVMDLTMPGVSPLDTIRSVSDLCPSCRVIAFSGYDDAETVDAALRAGAHALVSKGEGIHAILDVIRRIAPTPPNN